MNRRILKEQESKVELAIAKALSRAPMYPSEIDELATKTQSDLMIDHNLDSVMSERVINHVKAEMQRETYQSHQTYQVQSRKTYGGFKRTHPLKENADLSVFVPEDITDLSTHDEKSDEGRMLDYGHVKSDSHEGRMMRQALYEMSEYAADLHDMLNDDDDLPQWCHYKIAVARACIGKVRHYLEYKIKHPKR